MVYRERGGMLAISYESIWTRICLLASKNDETGINRYYIKGIIYMN